MTKASVASPGAVFPRLLALVATMAVPILPFSIPSAPAPSPSPSHVGRSTATAMSPVARDDGGDDAARRFSALRSVGVDYGLSRTGVAVTTGGYRPRPLAILSGLDADALSSRIVDCVLSERATNVVLGLPLHKNGTDSEQSDLTREFGRVLLAEVRRRCGAGVSVDLWDERYTSKEAASRIAAEAMARNQRIPSASDLEAELDADAACIILEDYYKESGEDAERVEFDDISTAAECEEVYRRNRAREEEARRQSMEERERGRNARRELMERDRAREEEEGGSSVVGGGGKKKKKKRKKKR